MLLRKLLFNQKDRFPEDYVQKCTKFQFGARQLFFFSGASALSEVFLPQFLSFFLALLLPLPFEFHILSGRRNKLGVNYGQSLEMGAVVTSWLVRSSPGSAARVRTLAWVIALCSWARHFTLTVPLSTQVYKWVPANLMLGVTLRWTSIPSRGK